MRGTYFHRVIVVPAILTPLTTLALLSPGTANAVECGVGTVYDPPSNTCIAAPLPPPPPPPPVWNGDITPYFSVGVCAPIPFVSICAGI